MDRVPSDIVDPAQTGPQRPAPPWMRSASEPMDEARLVEGALHLHDHSLAQGWPMQDARRARGPVAVVVLTGNPNLGTQADVTQMRLASAPDRSNDWRSLTRARTRSGHDLTVEIVAAPRGTRTPVDRGCRQSVAVHEEMRSRALTRLGLADRRQIGTSAPEPGRLVTIETGRHCREDGALHPDAVLDLVRSTERLVDLGGATAPRPHLHRRHVFEAVTPGEALAVATLLSRRVHPAPSSQSLRSCLRRIANRRVVAFCETVLR